MLRALLAVWLCLASVTGARAERVAVQSGEHDGFTRLVLDFAAPVGWQMTRTESGYRLALTRPDLRFDLSDVFRRVPRDRLASVWADPDTGALMLGIGCACHAFPFELRPDVLVIDLRDGPAPPGSSFERGVDGQVMPPVAARSATRPRLRPPTITGAVAQGPALPGYDWLKLLDPETEPVAAMPMGPPQSAAAAEADQPIPDPHGGETPGNAPNDPHATLAPQADDALRDALLRQISNGAARGAVDLAADMPGQNAPNGPPDDNPLPQIRIGGDAGVDPAAGDRPAHALTAEGNRCLPDAAVDVGSWGPGAPVAETIAARTAALYGEFDRVDPVAAETAVKYLLHLGFGAEARVLIETLPLEAADAPLWSALATVVDGDLARGSPLAGMEVCDAPVALWAVLARPDLTAGDRVQTDAILRAFSALPPHLRRHLGPILAGRFLARGDADTVRAIRDAILRPGGDPGPAVRLLEAELHAAEGHGPDTKALIALQSAPGPTAADATVAAVLAIVAEGGTVDIGMLTATEALLREYRGAAGEAALRHAVALAQATQGDFDAGFALLPEGDAGRTDLWTLLAERGTEAAVLAHALRGGVAQVPMVPRGTAHRMARRLIDLGFPDAALDWLNAGTSPEGEVRAAHLLLTAEAELRRRDARTAIRLLATSEGPEAAALRNEALLQLATPEPLQRVQADGSAPEVLRQRAARLAHDWARVAEDGPEVWRNAAALVAAPPAMADTTPLARAQALLAQSVQARAALQGLIAATTPVTADQTDGGS